MRWALAVFGVFLLVWLASGDARAQPWGPAWPPVAPPASAGPPPKVTFGPLGEGTFGAWVDLGGACRTAIRDHLVRVHFSLDGTLYTAARHIQCPEGAAYVGLELPLPAGSHAVVRQVYAEIGSMDSLRIPSGGFARDQQVVGVPTANAVAWSMGDLGVVGGLFLVSWWRDPSRATAASFPG